MLLRSNPFRSVKPATARPRAGLPGHSDSVVAIRPAAFLPEP